MQHETQRPTHQPAHLPRLISLSYDLTNLTVLVPTLSASWKEGFTIMSVYCLVSRGILRPAAALCEPRLSEPLRPGSGELQPCQLEIPSPIPHQRLSNARNVLQIEGI